MKNKKPLYRIRFIRKDGYYSGKIAWKACTFDEADLLNHKDAVRIMNRLSAIHMPCKLEPV